MYKAEAQLRTNLLGEPAKHVRPLSETRQVYYIVCYYHIQTLLPCRAIENGANALAEGFLFSVAAALIIGETWRSSRSQTKRREGVDDRLDELESKVEQLNKTLTNISQEYEQRWTEERERYVHPLYVSYLTGQLKNV